jgi:hypothetical protein
MLIPAAACVASVLLALTASATTITFNDGGLSATGTSLTVSATLATAADAGGPNNALMITLRSFGAPTVSRADVLSSFYFNIADPSTGIRPVLTYVSGAGQAYEVHSGGANDKAVSWTPQTWTTSGSGAILPSNLIALFDFDEGWQFKTITPPPAYPGLGFGIGTVGNSGIADLIPGATGTFDGNVIRGHVPGDMINLGIYSTGSGTDINPNHGLDGARLIRTEAVFRFTSSQDLDSLTTSWVQGNVTFGFGTNPDSILLPEPGTLTMLATGCLLALVWIASGRLRRQSVLWPLAPPPWPLPASPDASPLA